MAKLTVIFMGLMLFDDKGVVHLVKESHHHRSVTLVDGTASKVFPDFDKVSFVGLVGGPPTWTSTDLPHLASMYKPRTGELKIDTNKVAPLTLKGGDLTVGGLKKTCKGLAGDVTFWTAAEWTVEVPADAKINVDGAVRSVRNGMTILVVNTPKATGDHKKSLIQGLLGSPDYVEPDCKRYVDDPVSCPWVVIP
jgi:hypothetical protein